MHLAYVTTHDPHNPSLWAGTTYHMARALEAQGIKLSFIGPLREHGRVWLKAQQVAYAKLFGAALHRDREPVVLDGYARQIVERVREIERAGGKIDAIFSPGTIAIARLEIDKPIIFWTDATYAGIVAEYVWELPASKRSRKLGDEQERGAIRRSALAIYSSDWAARSAIEHYGADPARVKVVPLGANIDGAQSRSVDDVARMIDARPFDRCRLLFVGVGWERKGGDVAVEVARRCNEDHKLPTELLVLGSNPPANAKLPEFVKPVGFVDKKTPEGRAKFDELFGSSHFLLLPARAEAFGVVLCEANSYGVPDLATRVGGIPTIVRDGVNGILFAPDDARTMAELIAELMRDPARYRALARSSFDEYQKRLNWSVAGATVKRLIEEAIVRR